MLTVVTVIHVLVCVFLIISILFQVGKGASIGSTFGGASSQTLFGSAGPATFLSKVTAASAVIFMVTSLYITYSKSRHDSGSVMADVPVVKEVPVEKAPEQEQPAQ
ncbi:MAG TPA: preprotein translocase subunit SecG [Deltaproteobacteria bacterium]|nr:preprotein translocase subunit SecG [Deltaproteobacteria bacterium]